MANDTFGDIIQAGLRLLRKEDDVQTEAILKDQINLAHSKWVNAEPWEWLLRGDVALTLPAGSSGVTLPDGSAVLDVDGATPSYCRQLLNVSLESTGRDLDPTTRTLFGKRMGGAAYFVGEGIPTQFTIEGRILVPFPYPADAGVVHLTYIAGHADMAEDGDIPVVPPCFTDVVILEALAGIVAHDSYGERLYDHYSRMAQSAGINLRHCSKVLSPEFFSQWTVTGHTNRV